MAMAMMGAAQARSSTGSSQRERQMGGNLRAAQNAAKDPKAVLKSAKSFKKKAIQQLKKYIPGGDYVEDIVVVVLGVAGIGWFYIALDGLQKRNMYRVIAILAIWIVFAFFKVSFWIAPIAVAAGLVEGVVDLVT